MLVVNPSPYKHRKFNRQDCPSWGDEGWTFTPLSAKDRSVAQAPFTKDGSLINIELPEFDQSVKSILVKVKSTLMLKRVTLLDFDRNKAVLDDPDGIISEGYVGGIVSIARFDTVVPFPNHSDSYLVDLKYQPESGKVYPMAAIYYDGEPLQLDPDYLHDLQLWAYLDGFQTPVPTAWVDPGFEGTLYVPWLCNSPGKLIVNSYKYPGSNRYQGYKGQDRLYKNPEIPN